ncbi:hypothetical protein Tco_0967066 [Tanacetum coccineum]
MRGLSWSHVADGKDSFVKCDMTENDDFVGVQVKASISTIIVRVPEKDRWCGTRGKFVLWKGVRVTKASKRAKYNLKSFVEEVAGSSTQDSSSKELELKSSSAI